MLDSYADALDKVHDALEQKVAAAGAWEGDSTVKVGPRAQEIKAYWLRIRCGTYLSTYSFWFVYQIKRQGRTER